MNYDNLHFRTQIIVARYFDISEDGFIASPRVKSVSIEEAVKISRKKNNAVKARRWKAKKLTECKR